MKRGRVSQGSRVVSSSQCGDRELREDRVSQWRERGTGPACPGLKLTHYGGQVANTDTKLSSAVGPSLECEEIIEKFRPATNKDSDDCTKNKHHPTLRYDELRVCEGWSHSVKLTAALFSVFSSSIPYASKHSLKNLIQIQHKFCNFVVRVCGFLFSFPISR